MPIYVFTNMYLSTYININTKAICAYVDKLLQLIFKFLIFFDFLVEIFVVIKRDKNILNVKCIVYYNL